MFSWQEFCGFGAAEWQKFLDEARRNHERRHQRAIKELEWLLDEDNQRWVFMAAAIAALKETARLHRGRKGHYRRKLKEARAAEAETRIGKVRALTTSPNAGEAQAAREALRRLGAI
jgi:hypothetical protein